MGRQRARPVSPAAVCVLVPFFILLLTAAIDDHFCRCHICSTAIMPKFTVTTSDKAKVEIPENQVHLFKFITQMMEALGEHEQDENAGAEPLNWEKVDAEILQLILKWTEFHADDPESSDSEDDEGDRRVDDIPVWDLEFIKQLVRDDGSPGGDMTKLYKVMQACNYLDIPLLLTFCCKFVAGKMKDLTVEQARAQFHIENDYTPEEEAKLKEENAWAEKTEN